MFGEKFAHFSAVRTAEQLLHATIHVSSIVVSRYTRLDSFVVEHIALFSLEDESVLFLLLMCIYPLIPRPHQRTHSTPSFSTRACSEPPAAHATYRRIILPAMFRFCVICAYQSLYVFFQTYFLHNNSTNRL